MTLQLCADQPVLRDELCFSYSIKKHHGKSSRAGFARVLDISQSGLCMEISPYDSDLFVEWNAGEPGFNKDIELQIFCRSHPSNVFVEGSVKWFKQKGEFVDSNDRLHICAGVIFSPRGDEQKQQISELLERLNKSTTPCEQCGEVISTDAAFCFNCGSKLPRRRDIFKKIISSFLSD